MTYFMDPDDAVEEDWPPRAHVGGACDSSGPCTFIYVGNHVHTIVGPPKWVRAQFDKLLVRHAHIRLPASFTQYAALAGLWVKWPQEGEQFWVQADPPVKVDRTDECIGDTQEVAKAVLNHVENFKPHRYSDRQLLGIAKTCYRVLIARAKP